ncbi:MAG: sigma-70 family RNA polymerase sigma factor [Verrucomicrobia bacterium]|nr:sigma-70 family RNA polymerase sigma factor [Verrucomicrobiota bacterium]
MSDPRDPDAGLMLRVKRGDLQAFEALVDKYRQPVLNLAFRIVRDATEAEDVAQTVFVQVWKAADRYEISAKFTTWLFTITRNLCLNELRRRSRHPADSLDETFADDDESPLRQPPDLKTCAAPDELLHAELLEKVEAVLAHLPESQRTALLLHEREELSYEEVGRVLGCTLPSVKSLIHRARETLKARLKPYLRTGAWRGAD